MRQDGLIRHIGLSNVSADQLRSALAITDIAAVTVHYNVAVRLGAAVRQVAQEAGIVFSAWHPGAIPGGDEGRPFHAAIDPIAEKYDAPPRQTALAWLHRTEQALPIPGTASTQHLKENLAAAHISLTPDEVDAITALAPKKPEIDRRTDSVPPIGRVRTHRRPSRPGSWPAPSKRCASGYMRMIRVLIERRVGGPGASGVAVRQAFETVEIEAISRGAGQRKSRTNPRCRSRDSGGCDRAGKHRCRRGVAGPATRGEARAIFQGFPGGRQFSLMPTWSRASRDDRTALIFRVTTTSSTAIRAGM